MARAPRHPRLSPTGGLFWSALLGLGPALVAAALLSPPAAQAGPVICNTTIEAPLPGRGVSGAFPASTVEVTRCGVVQTTSELVERRFYSYTAPFARGVSLTGQITDVLGISAPGRDGGKIVAFGFPDQTIVWDGSALDNTYQALLEEQSSPIPWRTADVGNGFCSGLSQAGCGMSVQSFPVPRQPLTTYTPVRGLW
ncbi:Occludin/ELL family protein [Cyanobium sp. ATX 6F1]|uniref:Occludin/ELL family protein n=1 Tax=unclassified Cyanobium TaxID=2627006 RepID=UPI0020CCC51D|nr:Occludin/ELL family protein [Cyanobium sp. ATX 6F1]MCP9916589.1 Occludin/ELL family protein [Cyanobium sp. ATX 6F1]